MTNFPPRLVEIAEQVKNGKTPQKETVRTLLGWFGIQRRGIWITGKVHTALNKLGIRTEPSFEFAYIDGLLEFLPAETSKSNDKSTQVVVTSATLENLLEASVSFQPEIVVMDPTYRIGKLASANTTPVSVKLDMNLEVATSLMLLHDFSQLPVMENERDVKGIISWTTIGSRLALGQLCKKVRDCIEPHHEISADVSLFAAIDTIVTHEYVLIRDSKNKICGIVTTSDLSQQFRQLGEPFLLLGEIENHIRRIIQEKFTLAELETTQDPSDKKRVITSIYDLTFGEYIRLLQNPVNWSKLKIFIDRGVFIEHLDDVRRIRNDVMHFDPDGVPESDLSKLRGFVRFLQGLNAIGIV